MKRIAWIVLTPCLLICSTAVFAAPPANPADYTVTIHLASSQTAWECTQVGSAPQCSLVLVLHATIDGRKFTLERNIGGDRRQSTGHPNFASTRGYLALGDYKAKLQPGNPKDPGFPYYIIKSYEMMFADGRVADFQVVGQTE